MPDDQFQLDAERHAELFALVTVFLGGFVTVFPSGEFVALVVGQPGVAVFHRPPVVPAPLAVRGRLRPVEPSPTDRPRAAAPAPAVPVRPHHRSRKAGPHLRPRAARRETPLLLPDHRPAAAPPGARPVRRAIRHAVAARPVRRAAQASPEQPANRQRRVRGPQDQQVLRAAAHTRLARPASPARLTRRARPARAARVRRPEALEPVAVQVDRKPPAAPAPIRVAVAAVAR